MFNPACSSQKCSYLALLSVVVILLAWTAPAVLAVTGELWEYDQPANDPANEQVETIDVTDDPAVLFASRRPGQLPIIFTLHFAQLFNGGWSPTAPVRPPNHLNSI